MRGVVADRRVDGTTRRGLKQHEGDPRGGAEAVQHDEQCAADRVGQQRFLFWVCARTPVRALVRYLSANKHLPS